MTRLPLAALLAALTLHPALACVPPPSIGTQSLPPDLMATEWQVDQVADQPRPEGSILTLAFSVGGTAEGGSGCGTYSAGYAALGDGVGFGGIETIRAACGGDMAAIESLYLDTLQDVVAYDLSDDGRTLTLSTRDGTQITLAKIVRR